ncbi:MAG: hypothetical protein ACJ78Q_09495, partial [Chloroflexia bacterium]
WTGREVGNSAPVVGDVDGDGFPDIVVTTVLQGQVESEVRAYDRHGQSLPHFPKTVPLGVTYMPALADLEGDGSTDIILAGGDGVWAYDLHGPGPYGPVLWGQFGGGPAHRNSYPLPGPAKAVPTPLPTLTPTVTATPQPPTPTATAVPQQLAANRSGLFRSVLVRSAWNLLLPFFWPFLFMSAFALAYNGYTGWLAVKPQVILRAAGLWLATCAGGGAALMAGLIGGLYAYGVTGNLLGSPAPNLVASLTTPQGRGQMLALVLVGGLITCMVGALAGGLQWLLFQGSYSHMSLLTWVRAGLTFWPASYGISLVITLLSGLIPWSVDPVNVMSICAVVVGARAGKILCDLVEEAGKPGPAPYRAIELKPSDLDLQSEEKGLRWGRLKGTYRDRPPKLPMSITDTAIVAARPADTGTGILLYLLALVGFFVMLWLALTFGMQNQGSAQATGPAPAPSPAVVVPAPTAQLPLPEPTTTSGPLAQIAADMKVGEGLLERGTKHMEQGEDATGKAELQTAIQMFDHALAIYSVYAPPYYDRAQAYAALGQPAQAAADLNRVLTLTEDPLLKQKALARLSELGGSGK